MKFLKTQNLKYILLFSFCIFFLNPLNVFAEDPDCTFILGDLNNHESFAYFLQEIFNLIKIAGPILVIVLTIIDLVKLIASQDKDGLSKMVAKTGKRLIFAILLFLIPSLLDFFFKIFSVYGVCNIT